MGTSHLLIKNYFVNIINGKNKNSLKIVAYCLMTNHIHLIAIPSTKESLSHAIGETHRLYTRKINFEQKVRGHLFKKGFILYR